MDLKRVLTAVIGFPLVAILLIFGNRYVVDIAFAIVALMAIREFFNAFKGKAEPINWLGYVTCIFIAVMHIIPMRYVLITIGISIPLIITILFAQVIITNMKTSFKDIAITFFGICYIVGFILFMPLLNASENGKFLIWYILFAAWGTDLFAYFVGKKLGKHKFSKVSPNKSIEGCVGGIIGSTVLVLIYTIVLNNYTTINIPYWYIIISGVILSIISQLGDFAASSIKRYVGIKDFSNLFPGHGGMLDRIDSIIFVAPFAYFLLTII